MMTPTGSPKADMKHTFTATVWREDKWFIAQCLEVDIASQGETEKEALASLQEALELHFVPPVATGTPSLHAVEVDVHAA